ncbi:MULTISPECIES: ABC transporter permease [unclassified Streptomyces]|uniref:ABC transporter permease n=1 Tax=unclassified Streptomyces TaxID=2593676 RepID=UPI002E81A077|nr:ABC transporter permease [Streptomyces sp. NBC_00562]WTC82206.1 ABC transporter permease [Streptomyces sp. NBC_01653]WTD33177.1 ABC transporter permease [Streptomyces sp. NBC_01643]WTD88660.1 ABC transporter permease [Streptomyces sp. NBC_01637]WUC19686.1 ABC transporter permease [Streptomyces sp. NBC_00562]
MLPYIVLEIRRTLRDGAFMIFGIGMPVLMYLLFTNLGGGGDAAEWKVASMVGMAAYGALGAAMSIGTGVASDKSLGWLQQLRITPLDPSRVVAGRAISGSVTVLPTILVVLLAGAVVNGVRLEVWQWTALTLLLWIGALPFTLLGIGNGYRLTPQATGVVNVAALMGFAIVGGLWFPLSEFPSWVRSIGAYTPAHRFADLGWATTEGHAPSAGTIIVLAGWLLLFGAYAVVSYRRSARTA